MHPFANIDLARQEVGERTARADRRTELVAPVERRRVTDAMEMRALAHPVRVALLDLLGRDGPMTATAAGEALGESPANASFHLRTLAKHGFVEEAPGGRGRQRPWRRVSPGHSWDDDAGDAATAAVAQSLSRHLAQRAIDRRETWEATRATYSQGWREAAFTFDTLVYLTDDELRSVGQEIMAIVDRYVERVADRTTRPDGALPVAIVATGHPLTPTPSGN
ncbi:MAG: helix-turn-helix domain-containing protein [Ilumatobacteraceae bacterium]